MIFGFHVDKLSLWDLRERIGGDYLHQQPFNPHIDVSIYVTTFLYLLNLKETCDSIERVIHVFEFEEFLVLSFKPQMRK